MKYRATLAVLSVFSAAMLFSACSQNQPSSAASSPDSTTLPGITASDASSDAFLSESTPANAGANVYESWAVYHSITPEEAKKRIEENENLIIVDVRTPEEYNAGHIEGAILIPNETIGDKQPEKLSDLDAEILVYCRTGIRSRQASDKFVALGYTGIYDLGGIQNWPYETVTEPS